MATVVVNISDDLYERMELWRDVLNISRVCEKALEKEVRRLSRHHKRGSSPLDSPPFEGPAAQ
jgi:hypothetical protein